MTLQPTPDVHENFADKQSPGNRAITGRTAREGACDPLPPTSIIELKPGDRFVMRLDCHATREILERINATWKQFAGEDVKLLILDKGMELTVARETTPEQHQQADLREPAHQAPVAWRWRWKDSQAWVLSDQAPQPGDFRVIEPLSILTPTPESQVAQITDAQVAAAVDAYWGVGVTTELSSDAWSVAAGNMRRALEAALASEGPADER